MSPTACAPNDAGWYEDALAEFLPAAEAGDTQAQLALASMYQFGEGVAQNDVEAARWTRAAAESGDAVAQINLSQFFAAGRGAKLFLAVARCRPEKQLGKSTYCRRRWRRAGPGLTWTRTSVEWRGCCTRDTRRSGTTSASIWTWTSVS